MWVIVCERWMCVACMAFSSRERLWWYTREAHTHTHICICTYRQSISPSSSSMQAPLSFIFTCVNSGWWRLERVLAVSLFLPASAQRQHTYLPSPPQSSSLQGQWSKLPDFPWTCGQCCLSLTLSLIPLCPFLFCLISSATQTKVNGFRKRLSVSSYKGTHLIFKVSLSGLGSEHVLCVRS